MRFTTSAWSTLINVFIISSVALLSRIQVANATSSDDWVLAITTPKTGDIYSAGVSSSFAVAWERNSALPSRTIVTIYLKNGDLGDSLELGNAILSSELAIVTYPEHLTASSYYYVEIITPYGNNQTGNFKID